MSLEAKKSIALSRLYLLRGLRKGAKQFPQFGQVAKEIAGDDVAYAGFSLEDATKVAYCPKPMDRFDVNHRMRTKLGRYIRRRFPHLEVSDAILNNFTNLVVSCNPRADENIKIITGKAILKAYHDEIGGHSCMTGLSDDASYVKIYAENDCIRMMIYEDTDTIARALLWTTDDGAVVLDRIYPNYGSHVETMQRYAAQQGWIYRNGCSCPDDNGVELSDNSRHRVTIISSSEIWPYLDTFRFAIGNESKSTLYNYPPDGQHVILNSTEGFFGEELVTCDECEDLFREDRLQHVDNSRICETCLNEYYWWSGHESRHFHEDIEHVSFADSEYWASQSWADSNSNQCERCGNRYVYNSMNDVRGEFSEVCDSCFRQYTQCDSCNEFYEKDDLEDGLCPKCHEEKYGDCEECGESTPRDELEQGLCIKCQTERDRVVY